MWCPGKGGGRGRCVTSEEVRLDWPASELADCGRPHASRGAALLEQGGPLRGRGGGWGTGTVATDRSPCVPRYGVGWGCAVGLRVGWGCAVRLRVG